MLTAYSNQAAQLLPQGRTVHSALRLPLSSPHETPVIKAVDGRHNARVHTARLIVADECSMMRRKELEAILVYLDHIKWRGVLLLMGNTAQLPPVLPGVSDAATAKQHISASPVFRAAPTFTLADIVRARADADARAFVNTCLNIGYDLRDVRTLQSARLFRGCSHVHPMPFYALRSLLQETDATH